MASDLRFYDLEEKTRKHLENKTIECLTKNDYYIDELLFSYPTNNETCIGLVKKAIQYCFNSEFCPLCDEKDEDYRHLEIDEYIVSLDDIHEVIIDYLWEYNQENEG